MRFEFFLSIFIELKSFNFARSRTEHHDFIPLQIMPLYNNKLTS